MKLHKTIAFILSLALLLSMVPAVAFPAQAATDGYYTYTVSNGKATITDCNTSISGEVTIPSSLGGYPVTSIGADAFWNCTALTSITIPDSVTSIGRSAFSGCRNLTSVTIPDSVTSIGNDAFECCTGLTSITIPDSVTSIGNYAFYYCISLTSITIPDSVTSIGKNAFYQCYRLTSITIPDSVTSIGDYAFCQCTGLTSIQVEEGNTVYHSEGNCLIETASKELLQGCNTSQIPADGSVTSIYGSAFYNCTGLTSITIPDSVTSIGSSAFLDCTGLEEINFNATAMNDLSSSDGVFSYAGQKGNGITVNIGANVTKIPARLFSPGSYPESNLKITAVNFAAGSVCTSIGGYAFEDCDSLTSITIPDSVTSIGNNAFIGCGLTSIQVEEGNTVYYSAGNCLIEKSGKTLIQGCKTSQIPADGSVTSIGDYAFYYCTGLTGITIPDGVTSIGDYAFQRCTGLTGITIPDGVTSIGKNAFYYCNRLTSITIPNSVANIGNVAFNNCTRLEIVHYSGTEDDRAKIQIGSSNTPLTNAVWHYMQAIQFCGQDCYYCAECGNSVTADGQAVKATVKFLGEDGGVLSEATYYYGEKVTIPTAPEKSADDTYTYTFVGWDQQVSNTCQGNAAYTAVYTPNYIDYTVEFKNWDGSLISSKTYHYGDSIQQPEDPTKATDPVGTYTFTGWDKPVINCAGNATYTAVYTTNYTDYTVEFKNWDGSLISSETYHYGDTVEIPGAPGKVPDKTFYYIFTGWNKTVVNCTGNTTYTAVYSPMYIDYTVTFVDWDGAKLAEKTCHYGETVEAPADPTRPDGSYITYEFAGWTPELQPCQGNATYTATYRENIFLQDALQEAAQTGGTVKLTQDTQVDYLTLGGGATLDLNGYTLTADYFTSYGTVVDGTIGGNALVVVNKGIHVAGDNSFMPIYDSASSGYRFYKYELQNLGFKAAGSGTVKAGFRLTLANPAGYGVLSTTTDIALDTVSLISWTGSMGVTHYTFSDNTLRNYAALAAADMANKGAVTKAITLTLTGVDSLGANPTVNFQPTVATAPGMTAKAPEAKWTAQ